LQIINYILIKNYNHICKHKIVDSEFLSFLRERIFNKIGEDFRVDKTHKTNFLKKLAYLIKNVAFELILLGDDLDKLSKWEVIEYLYKFVLKKGANYLRQDSLQILIRELDKKKLKECIDVEGKYFLYKFSIFFLI
jgi:hypothetical protein